MKTLHIIAGANGSGKTTFAKLFSALNDLYFINADEIAKELDSNDVSKHKIKAGRIFFQELQARLGGDSSFVIETTLSGKYLLKYIQEAKERGFRISLIYLFLETPEANILRVANRVLNGGHDVPTEDIIRRYYRSKNLFWYLYKDHVDDWIIYYNSNEAFEEVADQTTVYDNEKYQEFMKEIDHEQNN